MSGVPLMPFGNRYLREQQGSNFFNLMRACSGRHTWQVLEGCVL